MSCLEPQWSTAEAREQINAMPVTPPFVVAVVNETCIIRAMLHRGATIVSSEAVWLPPLLPALPLDDADSAPAPPPSVQQPIDPVCDLDEITGSADEQPDKSIDPAECLRCMVYSPNFIPDEAEDYVWDAEIVVYSRAEGSDHSSSGTVTEEGREVDLDEETLVQTDRLLIGTMDARCRPIQYMHHLPSIAGEPVAVALRLHRLRKANVQTHAAAQLADEAVKAIQDPQNNPRNGPMPLEALRQATEAVAPSLYHSVLDNKRDDQFRALLEAHPHIFVVFQYRQQDIDSRGLSCTNADIFVALNKQFKDPQFPCQGVTEADIEAMIVGQLGDMDLELHTLSNRLCSIYPKFRIAMSSGASVLVRWLMDHRPFFTWSTGLHSEIIVSLDRPAADVRRAIEDGTAWTDAPPTGHAESLEEDSARDSPSTPSIDGSQ